MLKAFKARIRNRLRAICAQDPMPEVSDNALRYLLNEVSDLRIAVRQLSAEVVAGRKDEEQTRESFSYQWAELTEGLGLVGDEKFEREMPELVSKYSDLPVGWFKGKRILDAGCGNGRWTYAFAKLGASVVAVDQSAQGVANVRSLLGDKYSYDAQQADLLRPLPFKPEFDLVWCYGVAHHTGNTKLAVQNVAAAVKENGRLFLMIYGEPTSDMEFQEINNYVELRRKTQQMSFNEKRAFLEATFPKEQVHGYFDAVSPAINDLHRIDEIESWLVNLGFSRVRKTLASRNHHIVADRMTFG